VSRPAHAGRGDGRTDGGGHETAVSSEGESNPKGGAAGPRFRSTPGEEDPEADERIGEGGALEASKALLDGSVKPSKGTVTPGSGSVRGRPRGDHRIEASSLWMGSEAEPQRAVTRQGGGGVAPARAT
jgi:hypothetical protein